MQAAAAKRAAAAERGHKEMSFILSDLRNSLSWLKAEMLMYLRINLDILSRDVDYSSVTNPVFQLDVANSAELAELPSAWREEDDAEDEAARPAAIARSGRRAAKLAANKAAAAQGAPAAALPPAPASEGGRRIRRPRVLADM